MKFLWAAIEIGFDGFKRLIVDLGEPENVWQLLNQAGYAPLPPYIVRDYGDVSEEENTPREISTKDISRESDLSRYQTVFAKEPGAVAAPTAGLHFTDAVLEALRAKGVEVHYLTLHVGAGTFKPMSSSLSEHQIEPERFTISVILPMPSIVHKSGEAKSDCRGNDFSARSGDSWRKPATYFQLKMVLRIYL